MTTDRKVLWEVIKGHMTSILPTYEDGGLFQADFEASIENFITEIEDSNILDINEKTPEDETTESKDKGV